MHDLQRHAPGLQPLRLLSIPLARVGGKAKKLDCSRPYIGGLHGDSRTQPFWGADRFSPLIFPVKSNKGGTPQLPRPVYLIMVLPKF